MSMSHELPPPGPIEPVSPAAARALGGFALPVTPPDPESLAQSRPEVWDSLSTEEKERANGLTEGMAERFEVAPESFSVLVHEDEDGVEQFTVAYSEEAGLELGSWDTVMGKKLRTRNKTTQKFTVEVDGRQYDTRKGMTLPVWQAMVEEARADGRVLPDSQEQAALNGEKVTWTLRTGEADKANSFNAPFVSLNGLGETNADMAQTDDGRPYIRFRPAVRLR